MKRCPVAVPLTLAAALGCGTAPNPSDPGTADDAGGPTVDGASPPDDVRSSSDARTDAEVDAPAEAGTPGLAADAGSWSCDAYGTDLCFCRSGSEGGSAAACGGSWTCCFLASSSSHYSCECTSDDQATCASTIAMLPNGVQVANCPPP